MGISQVCLIEVELGEVLPSHVFAHVKLLMLSGEKGCLISIMLEGNYDHIMTRTLSILHRRLGSIKVIV